MPSPTNLVQTTTPLLAAGTFSSGAIITSRALNLTGTVFSDVAGTLYIDQGGDGIDWDYTTDYLVPAGVGTPINVDLLDQYWQVRYTNGSVAQTVFRLFVNPRDPYGAFLQAAQAPSAGGAYGVLFFNSGPHTYTYLGRFDGSDEYGAITNAALTNGSNGKYAAFVVANCVVSDETIVRETEHAPDAF